MNEFLTWLDDNGQDLASVEVFDFPTTGRGMRATKNYNKNSVVLSIPLNLIITSKVCFDNETVQSLGRNLLKTSEKITAQELLVVWLIIGNEKPISTSNGKFSGIIFCISLLERRNKNSRWKFYIDVLPKTYTLPLFWEDRQLKLLPPYCQKCVAEEKTKISKIVEKINKNLASEISLQDYYWAYGTGLYLKKNLIKRAF